MEEPVTPEPQISGETGGETVTVEPSSAEHRLESEAGSHRRLWIRALAVVVVGLVADQVTKWLAVRELQDGSSIKLLPTLEFNLHYNSGFSFGTGRGAGPLIGVVVIVMTLYLINMIRQERIPRRSFLLSIILSGAIGNLSDRVFRAEDGLLSGKVVDFIDVTWFAIFNLADIFVVCGVIVFALFELASQRPE